MYYLYKITNLINNKIYIGQSINPQKRWAGHKNQSKKEKPTQLIDKKIKEYGIENFSFEIIACCNRSIDCDETEKILIKQYKSLARDGYGYNISKGGNIYEMGRENKDKKLTEEHKKSIGNANRGKCGELSWHFGKKRDKEIGEKISKSKLGKPNPKPEGWVMSDEAKLAISIAKSTLNLNEKEEVKNLYRLSTHTCKEIANIYNTSIYVIYDITNTIKEEGKFKETECLPNIGSFQKGNIPVNKGIARSEETKKKISEALKGRSLPNDGQFQKGRSANNRKLNFEIAEQIRKEYLAGGITHKQLSNKYNINKKSITQIINNKIYIH